MEMKEEPEDFYDTTLEPDVILIDSEGEEDPLSNEKLLKITKEEHNHNPIVEDVVTIERRVSTSQDSGPLLQCPTCKKYFKRLSSHMLIHQDIKNDPGRPYPCSFCPKIFKNLSNLTVHTRSHTGIKPYVCEVCNKGFTQSGNLVHHSRIHTGSKPYKCPVCERAFTQPGNLGNHLRLHSQEKPFRCHLCDRAFTQSSNLNSHLRNNHKEIYQQ